VFDFGGDENVDVSCQLRNGANFIGGATDRIFISQNDLGKTSLSMNGGAQVPAGGGEVSLWCMSQIEGAVDAQIMLLKVGGFS
jgi:hypothetical protein